jgi:hypothetical protein
MHVVRRFHAVFESEGCVMLKTPDVKERCEEETKAHMPVLQTLMLGVVAGGFIRLGALCFTLVVSDAQLSFGVARVPGGGVSSLGLILWLAGAYWSRCSVTSSTGALRETGASYVRAAGPLLCRSLRVHARNAGYGCAGRNQVNDATQPCPPGKSAHELTRLAGNIFIFCNRIASSRRRSVDSGQLPCNATE